MEKKLIENIKEYNSDTNKEKMNGSLMVPALYSILNEMNKLDKQPKTNEELENYFKERDISFDPEELNKYKKVYMGIKEHFIFSQSPNVGENDLFGDPDSIFSNLGLLNMNHSDNYKNNIINLFNYKKIEIIDFYDSNLNVIHKKYDDKNEKYSILKTYTTFEKSSESVNLIPTTILGLHGLDFSKKFFILKNIILIKK